MATNFPNTSSHTSSSAGSDHLQQLLRTYRQVSYSNDVKEKLEVIRKILAITPDDANWQQARRGQEEAYIQSLTNKVQQAVADEDYDGLEVLRDELISIELSIPIPPAVLDCINSAIHNHNTELYQEATNKLATELDSLYTEDMEGNLQKIEEIFNQLNDLGIQYSGCVQTPATQKIISEIQRAWAPRYQAWQQQLENERLGQQYFGEFTNELNNRRKNLELLNELYHRLQGLHFPIPLEVEQQYTKTYKLLNLLKLCKFISFGVGIGAVIVAMVFVGALFLNKYRSNRVEASYFDRLEQVVHETSNTTNKFNVLIKEIEEKHPAYLAKHDFKELQKQHDAKIASYTAATQNFVIKQKRLMSLLAYFPERDVTSNTAKILADCAKLIKEINALSLFGTEAASRRKLNYEYYDKLSRFMEIQQQLYLSKIKELEDIHVKLGSSPESATALLQEINKGILELATISKFVSPELIQQTSERRRVLKEAYKSVQQ